MKNITIREVEFAAFELAKQHLSFNEPIPAFSTRFPNALESCLMTPFQEFGGQKLYPSLIGRASILFYLMIKNHPFQNGNKRIALTTLFVFLYKNNKWLTVDNQILYNFTVWIAQSPPEVKVHVVKAIEDFIRKNLEPLQK